MRKQFFTAAAFISMALGCSDGPPTAPPPATAPLASVEALTPTNMGEGVVGHIADVAPVVRVRDKKTGKPLAGAKVSFLAVGGGVARNTNVVSDSDGIASSGAWEYRRTPGQSELYVWVNGAFSLSFKATVRADAPSSLFSTEPLERLGVVGDTVALSVFVLDRFDNALANVEVTFTVVEGSGTLRAGKTVSNQSGKAEIPGWALSLGANTLSVGVSGAEMLVFHALAVDYAAVKWFVLDSLAENNSSYVWSAPLSGISDARIGFFSDEHCLCISPQGYFIRTIKYINGQQRSWTGSYKLVGSELVTSYAAWYTAAVQGDRVVLNDWDPWDEDLLMMWIYKPLDARTP
jgi:hypothetical protein